MKKDEANAIMTNVMSEIGQSHATRRELFKAIENKLGRPVVTYLTRFGSPAMVDDSDVDMLEGLLQTIDLKNGLALLISSPGGDGTAAERMINVCKQYSGTGEFWAIVPGKAKSAATMICLGASKIYMGGASELGPVDPQIAIFQDDRPYYLSTFHIVTTYRDFFNKAIHEKGRIEPYLQHLGRWDAGVISHFESGIELSKDISIKALKNGMMSNLLETEIEEKIKVFLTPDDTKTHGRPIFRDRAKECGLEIEFINHTDDIWECLYELYIRSKFFVDTKVYKLIESSDDSVSVGQGVDND